MGKPSPSVLPPNRCQCPPYRLDECLAPTGCLLFEDRFDLREGFFDRIEVRRVSREEDDALAALDSISGLTPSRLCGHPGCPR